jgi:MFS family permease
MWSIPVALPLVQADFGIARADASLPYTPAMMGFALGGVAMGRLCDRFVVVIMLGTLALGIGFVGGALCPSLLSFAVMHLFIGIGASATFGPVMADMSQWFVRHRGIAVGMAASGNYIGGAL